jgi:hypothetical protein
VESRGAGVRLDDAAPWSQTRKGIMAGAAGGSVAPH